MTPVRPPRGRRRLIATAAAMLAAVVAIPLTPAPANGAPSYTMDERTAAIASPALILVEARLEGYLRNRATGVPVHTKPVVVTNRCTGFAVSADGYALTTTHCLSPSADSMRGAASFLVANDLIRDNKLKADQKATFIQQVMKTTDFTGGQPDAAPLLTVSGQLFTGTSDPPAAVAISGRVVDMQPTTRGDATLLKFDATALPVVELDATTPAPDTHVVMLGFGTNDSKANPVIYTVQSRSGKVLGRYGSDSPPRYRLDGDIGANSAGGMVADSNGRIIGMITADMSSKDRLNNIVTTADSLKQLLTTAGATNSLTPTDQAYRAGLDAYFGGHYTDAIIRFDGVLAAVPNHLPAQTYRKQAADRLAIEGDATTASPAWLLPVLGVAGVALVAIVILVVLLLRARSRRAGERVRSPFDPYPPISGIPTTGTPTSGTPTSGIPTSGTPTSGIPASGSPTSGIPTSPIPAMPTPTMPTAAPVAAVVPGPPQPPPPAQRPVDADGTAWPAVTVWRDPHRDSSVSSQSSVPPPGPAPSIAPAGPNPNAAAPNQNTGSSPDHRQWQPPKTD